jgi:hypothetical protein
VLAVIDHEPARSGSDDPDAAGVEALQQPVEAVPESLRQAVELIENSLRRRPSLRAIMGFDLCWL